jgi:hypothetical protein
MLKLVSFEGNMTYKLRLQFRFKIRRTISRKLFIFINVIVYTAFEVVILHDIGSHLFLTDPI